MPSSSCAANNICNAQKTSNSSILHETGIINEQFYKDMTACH